LGIGAGLAINFGFSKWIGKWAKEEFSKDFHNYDPEIHGDEQEYYRKIKLDKKGRVKAFTYADVMAKLLGGGVLGGILSHHSAEPNAPSHNSEFPGKDDIVPNSADTQPNVPGDTQLPETPYAPEPSTVPAPEIIPPHIEHVVTAGDEWEKLLGAHGLEPYSQDMVDTLSLNHDRIINMWERWASGHADGMIQIQQGPEHIMQDMSIPDAQAMLERVISRGYPTLDKAGSLDNLQLWQAELERMTKTLLPGTEVLIPKP
jgi:hypothetical protein